MGLGEVAIGVLLAAIVLTALREWWAYKPAVSGTDDTLWAQLGDGDQVTYLPQRPLVLDCHGRWFARRRKVIPMAIVARDGGACLSAWCHRTNGFRLYPLSQIRSVTDVDSGEMHGDAAAYFRAPAKD